ncbi:GNAT family N-acetyltransferase [Arthrobacter sp. MMS18-M83]|uniref:GNAT family N-acetyltransferase n=1 Tax=Arthrobacter sp. MMS18-M83 TaxID=2996261 RepID=UPI00227BA88F|nr:GNAT family N-acetyltransferase [Arthrobacter sp. MMS18-M83]WAH98883.1 GNAT family N-acetyltransferase [Arthrobacter sp. MMS18-M83]
MIDATIVHNVHRERFEVLVDGRVIGKAAYKTYDEGGSPQRIFYHTVINEEYGGQGLAGRLAEVALNETVSEGLRIVPVCPFIKTFLTKHPEYEADTTAPTPAHLEYLSAALVPAARA